MVLIQKDIGLSHIHWSNSNMKSFVTLEVYTAKCILPHSSYWNKIKTYWPYYHEIIHRSELGKCWVKFLHSVINMHKTTLDLCPINSNSLIYAYSSSTSFIGTLFYELFLIIFFSCLERKVKIQIKNTAFHSLNEALLTCLS